MKKGEIKGVKVALILSLFAITTVIASSPFIVTGLFPDYYDENGYAEFLSFDAIETYKSSELNILEIISEDSESTLTYFIGSETEEFLKKELSQIVSKNAREAKFIEINDKLEQKNILGDDGNILKSSDYFENYTWQITDFSQYFEVKLIDENGNARYEGYSVKADVLNSNGAYTLHKNYEIMAENDENLAQKINQLVYATSDISGENIFYYNPIFSEFVLNESEPHKGLGKAIYAQNDSGEQEFLGIFDEKFQFADGVKYFVVDDYGVPSNEYLSGSYYAISSGFIEDFESEINVSKPYFRFLNETLTYVGANNGTHNITLSEDANIVNVFTDSIFVEKNNQNAWFEQYVLDENIDDEIKISLKTKTADEVLPEDFVNSDMIFVLGEGEFSEFSEESFSQLKTEISENKALVIPIETGQNHSQFDEIIGGNPHERVDGNSYFFNGNLFDNMKTFDVDGTNNYEAVLEQITEENYSREQENTQKMPETLTLGTVIRHLLNHEEEAEKSSIKVLEITPLEQNSVISVDDVKNLIKMDTTDKNIEIITQSCEEVNKNNENIAEVYDLIYISADIYSVTDRIDDNLDGLFYTSIGDLLDENSYERGLPIDISAIKIAELIEFSNAGFPLIISDVLAEKSTENTQIYKNNIDSASNIFGFLEEVIERENVYTHSFAKNQTNELNSQINTEKPKIIFVKKPSEFDGNLANKSPGEMIFNFEIEGNSSYFVTVLSEENGDYSENLDISIKNDGKIVENGDLVAGVNYTVEVDLRKLNSSVLGWQFKLYDATNDSVNASETGVFYKENMQILPIKILQIIENAEDLTVLDGEEMANRFDELYENELFEIQISSITIEELLALDTDEIVLKFDLFDEIFVDLSKINDVLPSLNVIFDEQIEQGKSFVFLNDSNAVSLLNENYQTQEQNNSLVYEFPYKIEKTATIYNNAVFISNQNLTIENYTKSVANAIVSSFEPPEIPPTVNFVNAKQQEISSFLIPALLESNGDTWASKSINISDANKKVYFMLTDIEFEGDYTVNISGLNLNIYDDNGDKIGQTGEFLELFPQVSYNFYLPDSVISNIANFKQAEIFIEVLTESGITSEASTLEISEINLLPLS